MIAPYQQPSSMQTNPLLARNIDETVNNLKNLEMCIEQLRDDLVNVAETTGNLPAAVRLRTPASLAAASPAASASAWSPFDIQRQLASPIAQTAASPYGPHDPYETAMNPYAASSPSLANPAAVSPYAAGVSPVAANLAPGQLQQAQIQQLRLAELARQGAISPFSQAAVNPYSQAAISPFSQAAISPFAQSAVNPFAQSAVNPFAQSAVNPFAQSAVSPIQQAAIAPWSHQAQLGHQSAVQRIPNAISQQSPLATQSPYAAAPNLAPRQLASQQINPGATIGPF